MRLWRKKARVERYAGWLTRVEARINAYWRPWADWLRVRSDRASRWVKIMFLVAFVIGGMIWCGCIIYYAIKS